MTLFLDAHQDIAYNMAAFGRDYTRPVAETRRAEFSGPIPELVGESLLGLPEYNRGRVAVVFGTLFAGPRRLSKNPGNELQLYADEHEAHEMYWQQLLSYHQLAQDHPDAFTLIQTRRQLAAHLAPWQDETQADRIKPVGIIPLMEGAEGIISLDELPDWWAKGVRTIGPAWAGNRFCGGTREPGPLTAAGRELLKAMAEVGFILDLSHMDHAAAMEAVDTYPGKLIASHANAAAIVNGFPSNRLLQDDLIRAMFARDAVIGVVPINGFLDWELNQAGGRDAISLSLVADQIDYLCQMAGDCTHVGLGTDFDGGIGLRSVPREIDSIADLPKINDFLAARGYTAEDISVIDSENFLAMIESVLPF